MKKINATLQDGTSQVRKQAVASDRKSLLPVFHSTVCIMEMPMSLADIWNRALMKRANPSAASGPPPPTMSQPTAKRCKSGEASEPAQDPDAYLDEFIQEMSEDGVDAALQELLKNDTVDGTPVLEVVPNSVPGRASTSQQHSRSCVNVLPGCCVARRPSPASIPPPGVRSANISQPHVDVQPMQPGGVPDAPAQQTPASSAALQQQQQDQQDQQQQHKPDDPMRVDESPNSVMRMLYPNLFV